MPFRHFLPLLLVGALSACSSSNEAPVDNDAGTGGAGGGPGVILDGGGTIPAPPDGAKLCPQGTCNYQTQSGCPASQSCRPAISGSQLTPSCQPAAALDGGTGKSGDSCTSWNDCARGYLCAGGECHRLCCGDDWSACPSGESCIRQLLVQVNGKDMKSGADLCFPVNNCDVLDPLSCQADPGRTCQIVDPTGNVACAPEGQAGVGEACSPTVHCSAGFSCVAQKCRRLCRAVAAGGEPSCPSGEGTCIHYNRDPAGVGECTPL